MGQLLCNLINSKLDRRGSKCERQNVPTILFIFRNKSVPTSVSNPNAFVSYDQKSYLFLFFSRMLTLPDRDGAICGHKVFERSPGNAHLPIFLFLRADPTQWAQPLRYSEGIRAQAESYRMTLSSTSADLPQSKRPNVSSREVAV